MDVFNFLTTLPSEIFNELYQDAKTCKAIFRSLPPIAKQITMRLLFLGTCQSTIIQSWVDPLKKVENKAALNRMLDLKICYVKEKAFVLNPVFRQQMIASLCSVEETNPLSRKSKHEKHPAPTLDFLEKYSQQSWDSVLNWMVGPTNTGLSMQKPPSQNIVQLLINAKLMVIDPQNRDDPRITMEGFKFLLKDVYSQMWILLLEYIKNSGTRGQNIRDILCFLFQMSFFEVGESYSEETLPASQKMLVSDLVEFGILYKRKSKSQRFYPTKLAVSLCNGKSIDSTSNKLGDTLANYTSREGEGYIIVESNYRTYAYTSSPLKIALLFMFVTPQYRLPNLAVGIITRESVRDALMNGITSDQIINFLRSNAHPQIHQAIAEESARKTSIPGGIKTLIPETVADQIKLWETERSRVKSQGGYLYDQFLTKAQFHATCEQAFSMGGLIWLNTEKLMMMVTDSIHDEMKNFIKKNVSTPKTDNEIDQLLRGLKLKHRRFLEEQAILSKSGGRT
eukprot:TRINITY_DN3954_c0_g1_i1.p1 TRINITY_DN3954_c0_g1~~TRINITY_DN3954_c0_g1_i1.p1  ORF type:complete len:509 (-),score=85.55 TRINITY_DN3954_c0_g1_i1:75-1601(-)